MSETGHFVESCAFGPTTSGVQPLCAVVVLVFFFVESSFELQIVVHMSGLNRRTSTTCLRWLVICLAYDEIELSTALPYLSSAQLKCLSIGIPHSGGWPKR